MSPWSKQETPEEAAELARQDHSDFTWDYRGVQEFDARLYIALDAVQVARSGERRSAIVKQAIIHTRPRFAGP